MNKNALLFQTRPGTWAIQLWIQPNAPKTAWAGQHGDRLKLKIKAPPVDGKANQELLRFLASELGVKRSQLSIASGESSRAKTISIQGLEDAKLLEWWDRVQASFPSSDTKN